MGTTKSKFTAEEGHQENQTKPHIAYLKSDTVQCSKSIVSFF